MSYQVMKRHEGNPNAFFSPSEKNHSEKVTCYMILLYGILGKAKLWG